MVTTMHNIQLINFMPYKAQRGVKNLTCSKVKGDKEMKTNMEKFTTAII